MTCMLMQYCCLWLPQSFEYNLRPARLTRSWIIYVHTTSNWSWLDSSRYPVSISRVYTFYSDGRYFARPIIYMSAALSHGPPAMLSYRLWRRLSVTSKRLFGVSASGDTSLARLVDFSSCHLSSNSCPCPLLRILRVPANSRTSLYEMVTFSRERTGKSCRINCLAKVLR